MTQQSPVDVPEHGLERAVWTESDFWSMGWHDASIWAYEVQHRHDIEDDDAPAAMHRVVLDVDYITRWVDPMRPGRHFTFWVAPCTLVFTGVTELELAVTGIAAGPREVEDVYAVRGGWHVAGRRDVGGESAGFDMWIAATGFTQTFRRRPVHLDTQLIDLAARGGHSYDQVPAF